MIEERASRHAKRDAVGDAALAGGRRRVQAAAAQGAALRGADRLATRSPRRAGARATRLTEVARGEFGRRERAVARAVGAKLLKAVLKLEEEGQAGYRVELLRKPGRAHQVALDDEEGRWQRCSAARLDGARSLLEPPRAIRGRVVARALQVAVSVRVGVLAAWLAIRRGIGAEDPAAERWAGGVVDEAALRTRHAVGGKARAGLVLRTRAVWHAWLAEIEPARAVQAAVWAGALAGVRIEARERRICGAPRAAHSGGGAARHGNLGRETPEALL